MFGEESMYGQSMVHLDVKNRIYLPKFTYVEKDDNLLVIDREDYLSVCSSDLFDKKIKDLENLYVNSDSSKKREINIELLRLYSLVLKKVKVDNQHRINLGNIILDKTDFMCIGARNHVILDTKKVK